MGRIVSSGILSQVAYCVGGILSQGIMSRGVLSKGVLSRGLMSFHTLDHEQEVIKREGGGQAFYHSIRKLEGGEVA